MDEQEFKRRTKQLALDTIRMVEQLPRSRTGDVIGRQLLRSIMSVGANYRASCRGRSLEEIVSKLAIVEEEADESLYWLELLVEAGLAEQFRVAPLHDEAQQILAMTVASKKTLKARIGAKSFAGRGNQAIPRQNRSIPNRES